MSRAPAIASMEQPDQAARGMRRLLEPRFLVAVAILAVAAIGLMTTVELMRLHFKKLPVPLRECAFTGDKTHHYTKLQTLPAVLGNRWVQIGPDQILSHDVEEVLDTKDYLFRTYIDVVELRMRFPEAAANAQDLHKKWKDKSADECKKQVGLWPLESVVQVGFTYYTGKADTVAHIPEVCYTGEGYNEAEASLEKLALWGQGSAGAQARTVDLRLLTMELGESAEAVPVQVGYFFSCNGQWMSNSLGVRAELQSLARKYAYYAKVELRSGLKDRQKAARRMETFLQAAMPSIEQILPDWSNYRNLK